LGQQGRKHTDAVATDEHWCIGCAVIQATTNTKTAAGHSPNAAFTPSSPTGLPPRMSDMATAAIPSTAPLPTPRCTADAQPV
jgi:hypothetical protein